MNYTLKKRKVSNKDFSHRKTLGVSVVPSGTKTFYSVPITNQGTINDCTAFSATEIRQAKTGKNYDPLAFWNAEKLIYGDPNNTTGVDLQTQGATGVEKGWTVQGYSEPSEKASAYVWVNANPFSGPDMFDVLRSAILNQGPLSGGVDWSDEWTHAAGGFIPHTQNNILGGHDVTLGNLNFINGTDYIDLYVHWGAGFGDNGVYHLDRYMANKIFNDYGVLYWDFNPDQTYQKSGLLEAMLVNLLNLYRRLFIVGTYPPKYYWNNPVASRLSVRELCDEMGMPYSQKNILCACVEVESNFNPKAVHYNKDKTGAIWSTDYGIVQINDYFHIGEGKEFPSVDFVLNNPEACVRWMIKMFLEGKASYWSSYSSGEYKKYL